jgi:hypothetical protein
MKKILPIIVFLLLMAGEIWAQVISQWRGVDRSGIYNGKNLLQEWPDKGPELLWPALTARLEIWFGKWMLIASLKVNGIFGELRNHHNTIMEKFSIHPVGKEQPWSRWMPTQEGPFGICQFTGFFRLCFSNPNKLWRHEDDCFRYVELHFHP